MANRNFANSRLYTGHVMPVMLDCNITIGSTGAVSALKGPYVTSVTRMGTGLYQIKLNDNFTRLYNAQMRCTTAVTGSALTISTGTPLTVGTAYVITTLGTTTTAQWHTVGVPAGVTPAIGVGFEALATSGTGTGTVKAIAQSGITAIEVVGNPDLTLAPDPATAPGGIILIQCYGPTSSSVTTPIPVDPASGSKLFMLFIVSNSSVLIGGE